MAIGVAAVLAAVLSSLVRGMIALASKHTVDAAGIAAFSSSATLTPALKTLRIDPAATLLEE
jgi:FlaG/FlaF family flagellin (archaellin)